MDPQRPEHILMFTRISWSILFLKIEKEKYQKLVFFFRDLNRYSSNFVFRWFWLVIIV